MESVILLTVTTRAATITLASKTEKQQRYTAIFIQLENNFT